MPTPQQQRNLSHYERIVAEQDKERHGAPGDKDDRIYLEQHFYPRVMVRLSRLESGIPICWGAMDCLEENLVTCAGGHQVCEAHTMTCYKCVGV